MNFSFKPTILSQVIIALLCFWLGRHCTWAVLIPIFGVVVVISLIGLLAFFAYRFGKNKEQKESSEREQYEKLATQAEQLDEILMMPSVQLFPDIHVALSMMAAQKFEELGDTDKASELRATIENVNL